MHGVVAYWGLTLVGLGGYIGGLRLSAELPEPVATWTRGFVVGLFLICGGLRLLATPGRPVYAT
jgi:hypothetical protein